MTWPILTVRLKQKVVDLLDYESRCNLRISSKDDRDVVDSTKFVPEKFKITETPSDLSEGKSIIRLEIDSFTIWLTGKDDLTKIDRGFNREVDETLSEIKQENRVEVFQKLLLRFSNKGLIKADTVEMEGIRFMPPEDLNFKCSSLKIVAVTTDYSVEWLKRMAPKLEKFENLDVACWGDDTELMTIHSLLEVSKSLKLEHESGITDEQLQEIEATNLKLFSERITVDGVRKRLEPISFFPNNLRMKKITLRAEDENGYFGKILGGFENIHGIREPWKIELLSFGGRMRIYCKIWKKSERPCILYPFYFGRE
ncbi:Protein CBG22119 [Caenorhabditis briggsae]|uniref:Protein CBG22119 n=1 Tax=Caenorhabditis briggsae TaxID=6238 RepID=A8Y1K3_CAEBR|nr:Protein CBG22119 [Caenorhabditis briggsae]CAP38773.2 Protein CBG22119 [Caenorhabditis briggsae]